MTKLLPIEIVFALLSAPVGAYAETYNYLCKVGGKTYPLKVDDSANTLEWMGAKYKISEAECGEYGWHAKGNGTAFDFCGATQGYAGFKKDGNDVECNLKG